MENTDTITVSREQLAQASAMFDMLQMARENRNLAPGIGGVCSYSRLEPRAYMAPEVAVRLARQLGNDQAREYLGGLAYRDFAAYAQAFATQPTASSVHVDAVLTNMSVAYRNREYIGPLAIPRVQVTKRSDKYFVFDTANLRRPGGILRPVGGGAARSGYGLSTDNYSVEDYVQEHVVPDAVRNNADNPLSPDRNGTNFATDLVDLEYEFQAYTLLHTSANWTTNGTISTQWSTDTSDPLADVKTGRVTVLNQVARRANTLEMGYQVFEALALHPDLLDRCKYTGTGERPAMVTAQMMAALFMVDQVLVGSAVSNTAEEGQTASLSFVWGKHAWIGYVSETPALETPSAAYAFTLGRMADRYREEAIESDIIRVKEGWAMKAVAAGAGYRMPSAVA